MDVSRETPDVTTKPRCYDLTNILVGVARGLDMTPMSRTILSVTPILSCPVLLYPILSYSIPLGCPLLKMGVLSTTTFQQGFTISFP